MTCSRQAAPDPVGYADPPPLLRWSGVSSERRAYRNRGASLDDRNRKAVIALGADGLDRRAVQPLVAADERERRAAPSTLASWPSSSSTAPSRMTLSQMMTVPGRDSRIAQDR